MLGLASKKLGWVAKDAPRVMLGLRWLSTSVLVTLGVDVFGVDSSLERWLVLVLVIADIAIFYSST